MSPEENQTSTQSRRRGKYFPRTDTLPPQTPKFWVKEKDRYLRQLLIEDIYQYTGRELVVYFANLYARPNSISLRDGEVDACEKLIRTIQSYVDGFRVIIASQAKSAGTTISLSSDEIIMGVNSELGPIDPHIQGIPCEFLKDDPDLSYSEQQVVKNMVERSKVLAKSVFNNRLLKEGSSAESIVAQGHLE